MTYTEELEKMLADLKDLWSVWLAERKNTFEPPTDLEAFLTDTAEKFYEMGQESTTQIADDGSVHPFTKAYGDEAARISRRKTLSEVKAIVEEYETTEGVSQSSSYEIGRNHGRQGMQRDLLTKLSALQEKE